MKRLKINPERWKKLQAKASKLVSRVHKVTRQKPVTAGTFSERGSAARRIRAKEIRNYRSER